MKRLLIHICCAPCSIVPIDRLRQEGLELLGFWYNPNVHPFREYDLRRANVQTYSDRVAMPVVWHDEYRLDEFLRMIAFHEKDRCELCLRHRLEAAAAAAAEQRVDGFTTTLLYSKRQPHELIAAIGEAVGRAQAVPFVYRDFRTGWREGIERSKQENLYRQQYCGCIYSERDRFKKGGNPDILCP
jgi:predicted adenine nucleotide alpha hydrolase (AANH) superfamily ATPase